MEGSCQTTGSRSVVGKAGWGITWIGGGTQSPVRSTVAWCYPDLKETTSPLSAPLEPMPQERGLITLTPKGAFLCEPGGQIAPSKRCLAFESDSAQNRMKPRLRTDGFSRRGSGWDDHLRAHGVEVERGEEPPNPPTLSPSMTETREWRVRIVLDRAALPSEALSDRNSGTSASTTQTIPKSTARMPRATNWAGFLGSDSPRLVIERRFSSAVSGALAPSCAV